MVDDDNLLDWDDDGETEILTTAQYRKLLLSKAPQILTRALGSDPDSTNSVTCTLLRELGKLDPKDDPIILSPEVQASLDGETRVGDSMKTIVYAFLKGKMTRANAREGLEQLSILFEVTELSDLMRQLDKLKNGRGMFENG